MAGMYASGRIGTLSARSLDRQVTGAAATLAPPSEGGGGWWDRRGPQTPRPPGLRDLRGPVAVEAGVETSARDQLLVRPLLDHAAVLEHDDHVRVADGRESVRDHERR